MAGYAVDIHSPNMPAQRRALSDQNLVIGRAKESQIFLDSRTISRRHAELNCDPFGRWWVRDLGSHNGTLVNGSRIVEQVLKPGDQIQCGEFSLALVSTEDSMAAAPPPTTRIAVVENEGSGRVASLRDFDPPRLGAAHLSILSEFGQQLLALADPVQRLAALCKLMVQPEFHGRSALALRASKEALNDAPRALCDPQSAPGDQTLTPYISKTLVRTLLARNEPVLASNTTRGAAQPQQNMAELSLAADVMTISAVACPIKSEPAYTDLLYVLLPPQYGNSEWLALTNLAVKQFQQAESTWASRRMGEEHAAIERELSRAHTIQERLVPRNVNVRGLDFAVGFKPCRWVGGDYVDLIKGPDEAGGKVLLTIADVCGKGLPAALVASSLHMMTHTAMRVSTPLPEIMRNLNIYLSESLAEGTFVTMLAALLDPATGKLETINAGHPPGLFITPSGEVTQTQAAANLPLGIDRDVEMVCDGTELETGSYLLLFTDGLSELGVAEGQILGEEALSQHASALIKELCAKEPAGAGTVATRMTALLDALQVGMANDDRTFLVARRTG